MSIVFFQPTHPRPRLYTFKRDLQFALAPYYWLLGMDGDVEVKGIESDVDFGAFDNLSPTDKFATQIHFEAKKGDFRSEEHTSELPVTL